MAQGNTKGMKTKTPSGGRKKGGTMPKGKRDIAPKKRDHVRERATKKQLSAKINANIETQMVNAAKSGKLTIMKNKGSDAPVEPGKGKK